MLSHFLTAVLIEIKDPDCVPNSIETSAKAVTAPRGAEAVNKHCIDAVAPGSLLKLGQQGVKRRYARHCHMTALPGAFLERLFDDGELPNLIPSKCHKIGSSQAGQGS